MGVVVNTAGVATGFNPVKEPGWYDAVLTGHKTEMESESSGQPFTTMEFTLEDPREDGHKVWRNFSLQPKSLPYIKGAMVALGYEPSMLEGEWDVDEALPTLYGAKCKLLIRIKEYQGENKDDVKQVRSRDDAAVAAATSGKKSKAGGW